MRSCCSCNYDGPLEIRCRANCQECQKCQLTYMKWVVFTVIIQTSRRVSSVVRTLLFQEKAATGSKVVSGEGGRHLTGCGKLPGFGLTETLVQIQHLPNSFLFCSSAVCYTISNRARSQHIKHSGLRFDILLTPNMSSDLISLREFEAVSNARTTLRNCEC